MKTRSTQRKNSAVARASQSVGRANYHAWSGGIAALLDGIPLINTRLQPGVLPAKRRRAVLTACRPHQKPLKRFPASTRHNTGLKPGVNERLIVQTASEQSDILPTASAKSPAVICGTVSHKSAKSQKVQTPSEQSSDALIRQTPSAELEICQTVFDKFLSPIYATASRKSEIDLALYLEAPCHTIVNSNGESQRDSGLKPKVARNELPWVGASHLNNPNGVVARWINRGATPLGLKTFTATTQGSSFLATLGWITQSLWDCRSQNDSHFGQDSYVTVM